MFVKSTEVWNVKNDGRDKRINSDRIQVVKIAVRDSKGRFHGATNFKVRH